VKKDKEGDKKEKEEEDDYKVTYYLLLLLTQIRVLVSRISISNYWYWREDFHSKKISKIRHNNKIAQV